MAGGEAAPQTGVAPRLLLELFTALGDRLALASAAAGGAGLLSFAVKASVLEIYQENVYDLLSEAGARAAKAVVIRDNDRGEQVVSGVSEAPVGSAAEAAAVLAHGLAARSTASTLMNARSSRSHAVFSLTVEQTVSAAAEAAKGES